MPEREDHNVLAESAAPEESFPRGWWQIVRTLLVTLAIVLPIRYFIIQPFIVQGASMEPNFQSSEYLIIDEFSYYFREPERGEVVIFHYPKDYRQYFIKRVIGLPGEEVSIANGRITIVNAEYPNGRTLQESYLDSSLATYPELTIKLKSDEYFMLGDNREFSSDSRTWGPVKRSLVTGRVFLRVVPLTKFGLVPHQEPSL